jgi:hypothetical protein
MNNNNLDLSKITLIDHTAMDEEQRHASHAAQKSQKRRTPSKEGFAFIE